MGACRGDPLGRPRDRRGVRTRVGVGRRGLAGSRGAGRRRAPGGRWPSGVTHVRAARPLNDWCLRADDGSDPVAAGTALEIVEDRAWGASMAMELPALSEVEDAESTSADADAWIKAAQQLQALGLYQVVAS